MDGSLRCDGALRHWGRPVHKTPDINGDGAKWLIEQNFGIPGRIAIPGLSQVGDAATATAVGPYGPYKSAIAGAGLPDIDRIWARLHTYVFFRDSQARTVKGLRPSSKVEQTSIPIRVFHGNRDQTVPTPPSQWFVASAKSASGDVAYRELRDFAQAPRGRGRPTPTRFGRLDDFLSKGGGSGGLQASAQQFRHAGTRFNWGTGDLARPGQLECTRRRRRLAPTLH
jgi:hypothetical protein